MVTHIISPHKIICGNPGDGVAANDTSRRHKDTTQYSTAIQAPEESKIDQVDHPLQGLTEATPESVAKAWPGLDFHRYYKKKQTRSSKCIM